MYTNITIGADPELFIINKKTNKVVSAVGIIPGTKDEPHCIEEFGDGYALQTDNILAEFNIPPTNYKQDFIDSIEKMKSYICDFVKTKNKNYDILCCASQHVPQSQLRSKEAKQFGCMADYCIYTGEANKVSSASKTDLRSCGFHWHIGYNNPTIDKSLKLLHYIDAIVGLPSIIIDKDTERRKLYGKAGCFRLCRYGVEYRTLSSFFMQDPKYISWVWNQMVKAINWATNDMDIPSPEKVQYCINNNDIEQARKLCIDYNICAEFLE